MKRWIFWSLASVATFLLGCAIVIGISVLSVPTIQDRPKPIAAHTPTETESKAFVPEFRDLPNFDEIEYKEPAGKLIDLVEDGIYRRSEVVAKNNEEWLVLIENGSSLDLYLRKATVKRLRTVSWPGEELDAKLSFHIFGKQIIAVRNIKQITQGPVTTLFHKKHWAENENGYPDFVEISDGFRREFDFREKSYVIRTSHGLTKDRTRVSVLLFESGDQTQILRQIHHSDEDRNIFGSLLWVGDMDRDGKLDLYFDEFNEKGFTHTELHLSTYAEPAKLVGLAADFGMSGC